MIRKLQRKFVLAAMLALFIVLAALIAIINILNYRSIVAESDDTLNLLAESGGAFPDRVSFFNEPHTGFGHGHGFNGETIFQSRYFSVLIDADGSASAVNLRNVATVDENAAIAMALEAREKGRERGFLDGYRFLRAAEENDSTRWIFLNRERELGTAREFLLTSIAISLAGFILVFLLLVLFSSRIVRPIAQSYEKQKRFITDAGHELKTPITIIRADADVIEEDLPKSEWLDDIRMQTDRLASLTNDLIYLSRMEEDGAKPQMSDFSLSSAVQETAQPFQSVARTQNKAFTVEIQPQLTLHGDEKSIRKLVSILLDNAMKYSPENGDVALTLKKSGRQTRLVVYNTAQNIEKGSADRLFDRFYRTDASRNSETGGFGLGLSIAKAITEAHKGRIRAYSSDGQSLTVEAILPE